MGTDALDFEKRKQLADVFSNAIIADGRTLQSIAEEAGTNRFILSDLQYNGWSPRLGAENLFKLSEALHIDIVEIAGILGYKIWVGKLTPALCRLNRLEPSTQERVLGEIDALLTRYGGAS